MVPLLIGVSVLGFAMMHLAPGGPTALYTLNPNVTAEDIERIKEAWGLNEGAAHAYKFAALIGKILADLAVRGETRYPIDAFSATRAALSDPAYELALHM